jgi:hypothetical protein
MHHRPRAASSHRQARLWVAREASAQTKPSSLRQGAGSRRSQSLEASVRRGWRESSKRSSASVGADAPFRGKAQAGAGGGGVLDRRHCDSALTSGARRKAIAAVADAARSRPVECDPGGVSPVSGSRWAKGAVSLDDVVFADRCLCDADRASEDHAQPALRSVRWSIDQLLIDPRRPCF